MCNYCVSIKINIKKLRSKEACQGILTWRMNFRPLELNLIKKWSNIFTTMSPILPHKLNSNVQITIRVQIAKKEITHSRVSFISITLGLVWLVLTLFIRLKFILMIHPWILKDETDFHHTGPLSLSFCHQKWRHRYP